MNEHREKKQVCMNIKHSNDEQNNEYASED